MSLDLVILRIDLIRLLGKGKIQRKAIGELIALPPEYLLRGNILELISIWRLNLETQANLTEDERELFMIFVILALASLEREEIIARFGNTQN